MTLIHFILTTRSSSSPQINITHRAKPPRRTGITTPAPVLLPPTAPLLSGSSLATLAVALAVARKQLAVPQLYPPGQHPAVGPADEGHSVHPPAQDDASASVAVAAALAALAGTTTVMLPDTMVVEAVTGHEVTWQSRPVWQQPPP